MNWSYILQNIPSHHLKDRANQILDQHSVHSPEELNLRRIARYFGIPVHFRPENSSAQRFGDKYLIIVDDRLSLEERREKLAEEICHCLLPMGNQLVQKGSETNKQENLAMRMAAYLLVPRRFILNIDMPQDESLALEHFSDILKVTPFMVRYRFQLDYQHWLSYGKKEGYQASTLSLKVAESRDKYQS